MKKRVISAVVMIAVIIPVILLGGTTFTIFMTLLAIGGLYELIKIREKTQEIPMIIKIFAYILMLTFCLMNYQQNVFSYQMDYHIVAFTIFAFLLPIILINKNESYTINDALYMISSVLFIGLSFNLLILVRNYDLMYVIYLLLITTITDTFAFITGSYIGTHQLAPTISPNKTVEGLIGGVVMGTFVATTFYHTVINSQISLVMVIFTTVFLAIVGQLGDLVFSSIKRTYKVKDYSNIIPGHGGILDRFDSLIFVVLAFILVLGII